MAQLWLGFHAEMGTAGHPSSGLAQEAQDEEEFPLGYPGAAEEACAARPGAVQLGAAASGHREPCACGSSPVPAPPRSTCVFTEAEPVRRCFTLLQHWRGLQGSHALSQQPWLHLVARALLCSGVAVLGAALAAGLAAAHAAYKPPCESPADRYP